METRTERILEFLKENTDNDFEVSDIAFNVKRSEKTVEAALKKLKEKGLVTSRQNENGRVFWYALPSAPITGSFKKEEVSHLQNVSKKDKNGKDSSKEQSKINAGSDSPQSIHIDYTQDTDINTKGGAPADIDIKKTKTDDSTYDADSADIYKPTDFNVPQSPVLNNNKSVLQILKRDTLDKNLKYLLSMLAVAVIIAILIGISNFLKSNVLSGRIRQLETKMESYATTEDLKPFKNVINKINTLQKNIEGLSVQIDSLKKALKQASEETSKKQKGLLHSRLSKKHK